MKKLTFVGPRAKSFFLLLMIVGAALSAVSWIMVRHYLSVRDEFRREPVSEIILHPESVGIAGLEQVQWETSAGITISGWYVPSKNGAAVILCHGGNADRAQMLPELRILVEAGYGVLTFDWPGQGLSGGYADWSVSASDALVKALDWLSMRDDVKPGRIGGLGFSMGAFIVSHVAATDMRIAGVILEASLSDFRDHVIQSNNQWGWLSEAPAMIALRQSGMQYWKYRPLETVGKIAPRPVLIIWGDRDAVVPAEMTYELFEAAGQPKEIWIMPGVGHGGYSLAASAEYQRRVLNFFGRFLDGSGAAG